MKMGNVTHRHSIARLSKRIERVEIALAAVCLILSTFLIFLAAVLRSISRPINWSLDISLFLFAWAAFLAADVAFRDGKLVSLDVLVGSIPARVSLWIRALVYLTIILFLGALIWYGTVLVIETRERAFQGIPNFSYSWVTASLPVGSILIMRSAIGKLLRLLASMRTAPVKED